MKKYVNGEYIEMTEEEIREIEEAKKQVEKEMRQTEAYKTLADITLDENSGVVTIIRHSIENVLKYTELQLFVDMPLAEQVDGVFYYARISDTVYAVNIPLLMSRNQSVISGETMVRARSESKILCFDGVVTAYTKFINFTKEEMFNSAISTSSMISESKLEDKDYQFRLELSNSKNIEFPIGTKIRLLARE